MDDGRPYRLAVTLAAVQFLFVTCWTVYVTYLPQLAATVGIARERVIWILMLDQAVFAVMDLVMGHATDRVRTVLGRIGMPIALLTLVSCVAFASLPHAVLTGALAIPLSATLLVVWVVTSSALRAPPWVLLSRYAAQPRMPMLASVQLTGLAIGAGAAPFVAIALRESDPRLPFLLASVALALTTAGLALAERSSAPSPPKADPVSTPQDGATPRIERRTVLFVAGCGLLALATQVHLFVNSGPQYLRFVPAETLEQFLPVFWVGFNIAMFPGASLAERYGTERVMAFSAIGGLLAMVMSTLASNLVVLVAAQALAGAAWGGVLMAGFSTSMRMGHRGREGTFLGLFWAALSAATLLRMVLVATGTPRLPAYAPAAGWIAAALWLAGLVALAVVFTKRDRRREQGHAG